MNSLVLSFFMVHFSVASLKGELFYEKQCRLPKRNLILGMINLALFFSKTFFFFFFLLGPFGKLTLFSYKSFLGLEDVTRLIFSL